MRKRKKRRFKIGEKEREIIGAIGVGTLVLASFALPGLPVALKPFLEERGPSNFEKYLKKLAGKNIIYLGEEKIKLTKRGRELLKEISLGKIKINPQDEWDEVWHLVSYDIPKTHNKERDMLRDFLKRNDFYQIQDSLWVIPYECKEEVAIFAKNLNISAFIIKMTTAHLPNQKAVEEYYNL